MTDLNPEQVRAQLLSLGLAPVDEEDLDEITHRINAVREALSQLEPEGLDELEPTTVFEPEVARDES